MKSFQWILGIMLGVFILAYFFNSKPMDTSIIAREMPVIIPVSHATAIISWGASTIFTDPLGGMETFAGKPNADLILVTDIHQDHLSTSTLEAVIGHAELVVPEAVKELLPEDLAQRAIVLRNGESVSRVGFEITAIPMYNIPETDTAFHTKGRGNGYVVEKAGVRLYVAGDTSGTPEMRALNNIDVALVPMNLPYTMSVDEAADAVLAFKPAHVYPYHYRGSGGLSDVNRFKQLVNEGDSSINVELLDWYPEAVSN